jgi:hypothetical protein
MTFVDSTGAVLTKTQVLALTTTKTTTVVREFTADVFRKTTPDGGGFETGSQLAFHSGQDATEDEINAEFVTATVTSIVPATGPAAGGTVVLINGTNLSGTKGVTFGGTAGTAFKRISNNRVQVTTPAKTAGAYTVVTQDDAGDVTTLTGFTYS